MKIVASSSNGGRCGRWSTRQRSVRPGRGRPRGGDRRRRAASRRPPVRAEVRAGGSTGCSGPLELDADEIRRGAAGVPPAVRAPSRTAARHIRRVAGEAGPAGLAGDGGARRGDRAASDAARTRRLLRARRTPPAAVVAADDRASRRARPACSEVVATCPDPGPGGARGGGGSRRWSRLFRIGGAHAVAALAYGTATVPRVDRRSSAPATPTSPPPRPAWRRDCPIDFYAGPTEIVVVSERRQPGVDRRGPGGAGRARSRRQRRCC